MTPNLLKEKLRISNLRLYDSESHRGLVHTFMVTELTITKGERVEVINATTEKSSKYFKLPNLPNS
jgi:hypothetical protein